MISSLLGRYPQQHASGPCIARLSSNLAHLDHKKYIFTLIFLCKKKRFRMTFMATQTLLARYHYFLCQTNVTVAFGGLPFQVRHVSVTVCG
jgi:hypothetical protein